MNDMSDKPERFIAFLLPNGNLEPPTTAAIPPPGKRVKIQTKTMQC